MAGKEQFNNEEAYNCGMDYFYELERIKRKMANLESEGNIEATQDLKEVLLTLENTIKLMALYINDKLYYYTVVHKENFNECMEQKRYFDLLPEFRRWLEYQKIEALCMKLTPVEKINFMKQYSELNKEESKTSRVL